MELKDKKQCQSCYKEIEKDVKFCPNCGEKQTQEQPKEVEVLEKLENTEVAEEKETEKQIVIEELQESIQNKKEKTQEDEIKDENMAEEKSNLEKTVEIESNVTLEDNDEDEKE